MAFQYQAVYEVYLHIFPYNNITILQNIMHNCFTRAKEQKTATTYLV